MNYEHLDENSPDAMSANPVPEHIAALAGLFPQVVQEGKVNFEVLRELLGDEVMEEEELFGLQWHGKAQARRHALSPSMGTLRPCKEESKDWENTKNLYIEGDNLEVLKLLRKAYSNKVKMIYIDPPYNTGKEFVYPDNYKQSMETYLRITQQLTAFKANQESSGRYHTDWLNMMYPRLMVARDLLREDGVIFISIDDNEVDNLRKICSEIFGEDNFLCQFIWQKKKGGGNDSKHIAVEHEYIISYCKNKSLLANLYYDYDTEYAKRYKESDIQGAYFWDTFKRKSGKQYYPITCPDGSILANDKYGRPISWLRSESRFLEDLAVGDIRFTKNNGEWSVQFKQRMPEGKKPRSLLTSHGSTQNGSGELLNLFQTELFENPKPVSLVKHLLSFCTGENDYVLDFFSGSATSAQAIIQQNGEDNAQRRFILIQLPEKNNSSNKFSLEAKKAGYDNICDIAKERIRRAGEKIIAEADLLSSKPDIGFRVYRLDSSNVRAWNGDIDNEDIFSAINAAAQHLIAGRDEEDLLYEILLKQGIELTQDSRMKSCDGKKIYSLGHGQYYACLEVELPSSCVEAVALSIAEWKLVEAPDNTECAVFVVDSAFASDEDKQNFCKILEQHGVASIKVI